MDDSLTTPIVAHGKTDMTEPNETQKMIIKALEKLAVDQGKVVDSLATLSRENAVTTTMVKRFLGEQETYNRHVQTMIEQQEIRIRSLEQHRATMDARVPERMVDGKEISRRLDRIDSDFTTLAQRNNRTDNRISWFMGMGTLLVFVIPVAIPLIINWLHAR